MSIWPYSSIFEADDAYSMVNRSEMVQQLCDCQQAVLLTNSYDRSYLLSAVIMNKIMFASSPQNIICTTWDDGYVWSGMSTMVQLSSEITWLHKKAIVPEHSASMMLCGGRSRQDLETKMQIGEHTIRQLDNEFLKDESKFKGLRPTTLIINNFSDFDYNRLCDIIQGFASAVPNWHLILTDEKKDGRPGPEHDPVLNVKRQAILQKLVDAWKQSNIDYTIVIPER